MPFEICSKPLFFLFLCYARCDYLFDIVFFFKPRLIIHISSFFDINLYDISSNENHWIFIQIVSFTNIQRPKDDVLLFKVKLLVLSFAQQTTLTSAFISTKNNILFFSSIATGNLDFYMCTI